VVATGQVAEMRCGLKGQIAKMMVMADQMNVHLDLNAKEDYSDVLFFATNILAGLPKVGIETWCKKYRETSEKLFAK
jgi:hypothetical protein